MACGWFRIDDTYAFGAAGLVNAVPNSHFVLIAGLLVLVYMFFSWFGQVASESEKGEYGQR